MVCAINYFRDLLSQKIFLYFNEHQLIINVFLLLLIILSFTIFLNKTKIINQLEQKSIIFHIIGIFGVLCFLLYIFKFWKYKINYFFSYNALNNFFICFSIGIVEEIFFRRIGLEVICKKYTNNVYRVVLNSLFFGLVHFYGIFFNIHITAFQLLGIINLGIIYCFLYIEFGLLPAIVLHALWDYIYELRSVNYYSGNYTDILIITSVICLAILNNRLIVANLTTAST